MNTDDFDQEEIDQFENLMGEENIKKIQEL